MAEVITYRLFEDMVVRKTTEEVDNSYIEDYIPLHKIETIRVNPTTIVDIAYTFDLEQGEYLEQSQTEREDIIPETPQEKMRRLETENADFRSRISDIEMFVADMIGGA